MNLEEYRTVFVAGSLVLILAAAFPGLSSVVSLPSDRERFSELWLLGPERMAEGYPFNVKAGEKQGPVYVGVGNHMSCSQYYLVYVKFRNQTQRLPNSTACTPSPLSPLYEFRFVAADGEAWETPLNFTILDGSIFDDSLFVRNVSINGVTFVVNSASTWDSENNGFYYQLFFELWLYDTAVQTFQFHNRFVGIWLNMTTV